MTPRGGNSDLPQSLQKARTNAFNMQDPLNDDESSIRDDMMANLNLIGSAGRDTGNLLH